MSGKATCTGVPQSIRSDSSIADISARTEISQQPVSSPVGGSTSNHDSYQRPNDEVYAHPTAHSSLSESYPSHGQHRKPRRDLVIQTNAETGIALPHVDETEHTEAVKEVPVTWLSLPRKDQLAVLTLARLSEPLTQTSLGSYVFYQLQSFDPSLPDSTIAYQAGILHAAFPGAQFLTAILWGRFADAEYGGRKRAISIGLLGTMVSIVGFGFSHSFAVALFFRCLGGVLNGNIGVMRTMISEIIKEKKYQSRAFLLLPMTFNIGIIIGPILGELYLPASKIQLT